MGDERSALRARSGRVPAPSPWFADGSVHSLQPQQPMPLETLLLTALAVVVVAFLWSRRVIVRDFETAVFRRQGRFQRLLEPGPHWLLWPGWKAELVDLRPRLMEIAGQEVPTRDQAILRASVHLRFLVQDARAFEEASSSAENELYVAVQLALRDAIGARELEACLDERARLNEALLAAAREEAPRLGLAVQDVALKDLVAAGDLKRAMADVAKARAEGRAKLERARAETAAVRSLSNAARMLRENPGLYELRVLETATHAAGSEKNSLVLGLARDLLEPTLTNGSASANGAP